MAAEREPEEWELKYSFHLPRASMRSWLPSLKELLGQFGLHLMTDADLRVLEGCSKLDLGEVRYLAKHHEHDWAHAELARRGEKP